MSRSITDIAQFLWSLLDDIDTASDIAKSDDKGFRERVERIQRRRFEVGSTDGYTVVFATPQAVAPAEEIGAIERQIYQTIDDLIVNDDGAVPWTHVANARDEVKRIVVAALTSLSARLAEVERERDEARASCKLANEQWEPALAQLRDMKARATASQAEASDLRRKLEERERIGKMMANAIFNVHQRGLHVSADDMDSLKECQEAWDRALTTDGGPNG